ncbi:MAG TPA: hypothetical protein GX010_02500 [Erysipelotrichaceae bacterium]|nr:hypothetical protein [Erysipelotrichaceae bacterium]
MASTDLAIRFTEDKYASKNEVAQELKITSVDTFWSNILAYRSHFHHYLSLKTIEKNMLVFCGCPSINNLVNTLEMKLIKVSREYMAITPSSKSAKKIEYTFKKQILNALNECEELAVGEDFIESVIREELINTIPANMVLVNHLEALNYIKRSYVNNINEDFLAELYAKLLGTEELTSFYRIFEDKNPEHRVLIDRIYTSAPVNLIESMMNNLFSFIASSNLSPSLKAVVVFFYVNYVKPFSQYSEEIAILMAKAVLAHDAFGEVAVILPIEKLLLLPKEESARVYVEVQKTTDITYFVDYIFKYLVKYCDNFLEDIAANKVMEMREDFYRTDEVEPVQIPSDEDEETIDLFSYGEEQSLQETKEEIVEEKILEKPTPILEKQEIPKKKTVKVKYVQEELAVSYIPVALDEKQAVLLEQDLMERDPELRKGEAKFYARHCTKGKKYTIAQYKKSLKCAYETARTAMDHLVELNYYRKEKVKNKYVYIPVERD